MESFETYYRNKFRQDINKFIESVPDKSKYHDDPEKRQVVTIQFERLASASGHLNFLGKEDKEFFGIALFFTILADNVCFTHYKAHYSSFQKLTLYPKFIGDCPGGCNYHHHPVNVFEAMNKGLSGDNRLSFRKKFSESIEVMKDEITDFFREHLSEIDGEEFWKKCRNEFPSLIL